MPDYELERCKAICCDMKSRADSPEASFALARLLAYEGDYEKALRLIGEARTSCPADDLYYTWELALLVLSERHKPLAEHSSGLYSMWQSLLTACSSKESRPQSRPVVLPTDLTQLSLEKLWCYLELALLRPETHSDPRRYAVQLKETHRYYGYLSWGVYYLHSKSEWIKGLEILQELIRTNPTTPEAYLKLWHVHYYRLKDYESAMDVIEQALLKATEQRHFRLLISLRYAKTLFRLRKFDSCFDFLQTAYTEQTGHIGFLYLYGRFAVQIEDVAERIYAINALRETIRLGAKRRRGLAYYWLAKAHLLGRETAEAVKAFQKADLSTHQTRKTREIRSYLSEMSNFILSYATLRRFPTVGDTEAAFKAQKLTETVAMYDEHAANLAYSEILFTMGLQTSALAVAQSVWDHTPASLTPLILRLKMMKKQGNFRKMRLEAENWMEKWKEFPIDEVVKVLTLYAESMACDGQALKAVFLLKLLGKTFPPVTFSEFPYLFTIQHSASLGQLRLLPNQMTVSTESPVDLYGINEDFPRLLTQLMHSSEQELQQNPAFRRSSSTIESTSVLQRSITLPFSPESETIPCEQESKRRFRYCSNVKFLYKLGKLAVREKIAYFDACWALKDCLSWMKRRLPGPLADNSRILAKGRGLLLALLKEVRGKGDRGSTELEPFQM